MKEKNLSKEELEQLCQLYIECRLTVLEETELEYVLARSKYSSRIIDETRQLMSVQPQLFKTNVKVGKTPYLPRKLARWTVATAASIAILAGIGVSLHKNVVANNNPVYIAYADGHELSSQHAKIKVEAEMQKADDFLRHIDELQAEEEYKLNDFLMHNPLDQ